MTDRNSTVMLWVVLLVAVAIVLLGSNGVRGTDQYWYLADVETLAESGHSESNVYYPGVLHRNGIDEPNYFIHNGPVLYVVAQISKAFGVYNAWILVNLFCHLVVGFAIFQISRNYTSLVTANTVTALYLLSPVALWQTMNMLQEQIFAGLTAGILLLYFYRSNSVLLALFFLVLCVGVMSHPIYLLFGLLCLGVLAVSAFCRSELKKGTVFVGLLLVIVVLQKYKSVFYPSSFQPDLKSIIASSVPGATNMLFHYSIELPEINLNLLQDKAISAVSDHFFSLKTYPLYVYTNIALVVSPFVLLRAPKRTREIVFPCVALLGMYIGILCLMQSQFRYQQLVAPAVFILIALWLHKCLSYAITRAGVLLLLLLSAGVGGFMAITLREQSQVEREENILYSEALAEYPEEARILVFNADLEQDLRLGYLLKPRDMLVIKTDYLENVDAERLVSAFEPEFMIAIEDVVGGYDQIGIESNGNARSLGRLAGKELFIQPIK